MTYAEAVAALGELGIVSSDVAEIANPATGDEGFIIELGPWSGIALWTKGTPAKEAKVTSVWLLDTVSGTDADATSWTANEIARWASTKCDTPRHYRGIDLADTEVWFSTTVSHRFAAKHGVSGATSDSIYRATVGPSGVRVYKLCKKATRRKKRRA